MHPKKFSVARKELVKSLWLDNKLLAPAPGLLGKRGLPGGSMRNKVNRIANPAVCFTLYLRRSSSIGIHKRNLSSIAVQADETVPRCYKKKADGGWSGPRETEVTNLMEDHQPQPTIEDHDILVESEASVTMTEQQLWLDAVRGKKKGRVFYLGFEAHVSSWTYTSPSQPSLTSIPTPPQLNSAMEDLISLLEM
ncbi:UNVERIFIED_CONTAM: hypothetical protein Sindi_0104000 [Sesamum indicum]